VRFLGAALQDAASALAFFASELFKQLLSAMAKLVVSAMRHHQISIARPQSNIIRYFDLAVVFFHFQKFMPFAAQSAHARENEGYATALS
jgi:hypothetical protein